MVHVKETVRVGCVPPFRHYPAVARDQAGELFIQLPFAPLCLPQSLVRTSKPSPQSYLSPVYPTPIQPFVLLLQGTPFPGGAPCVRGAPQHTTNPSSLAAHRRSVRHLPSLRV